MLTAAATPQQAKPMPVRRAPLMRPAARPDTNAPSIIPLIIGTKNQPNWRSLSLQEVEHERRRRGDVQEQRAEVERARRRQPLEARIDEDREVVAQQRLRRFSGSRAAGGWVSGSAQPRRQQQRDRERDQEPEDHRPARSSRGSSRR